MSEDKIPSNHDELESAKILIQENLYDEAKHVLFRLLTRTPDTQSFDNRRARELLKKIEEIEMKELYSKPSRSKTKVILEDQDAVISKLESDLQLNVGDEKRSSMDDEQWIVRGVPSSAKELFDLSIAFFEMGCFADALRELQRAEKKIRIENSFLGELGVSIVALTGQTLIQLGQAFNAKIYLEPVLLEPDLPHEQKVILYYTMGLIEQSLDDKTSARGWFQKVVVSDPDFKDVQQRIRLMTKAP